MIMRILFLVFLFSVCSIQAESCSQVLNTYPSGFFGSDDLTLDPQSQELLKYFNRMPIALSKIPLFMLRLIPPSSAASNPDLTISDQKLVSPTGGSFGLKIYTPKSRQTALPVLVFMHGGGWVLGYTGFYDHFCQEISLGADCIVVAVDYRASPESVFPEPLEDCYFAAKWVSENIQTLGGDPARIAIAGDSAGGNLAAATCLMARDRKKPRILAQVLICPALNYNFDTLSYFQFAEGYFPTREDMRHFWNLYLGKPENGSNPYASPLQAVCLAHLPPTSLVVADFDPLRDDGLIYGLRLHREGVETVIKRFTAIHGFYGFRENELGRDARNFIIQQLKDSFQK